MSLSGEGDQSVRGGANGDLIVYFKEKEHPLFTRSGHDIYIDCWIDYPDAVLGVDLKVPVANYKSPPAISFSDKCGKGYGAHGHAVLNDDGTIGAVVIDTIGEGYPVVTDPPTNVGLTSVFVAEPRICHVIKITIVIGRTHSAITFHFLSMNLKLFGDSNGVTPLSDE